MNERIKMPKRRDILAFAAGSMTFMLSRSGPALAEPYPDRPVHVVVPAGAGAPDTVARIVAQQLHSRLKQPFVIENRPGANGTVGTNAVTKAQADGYTLLVSSTGIVVNPSIYRNLQYNVLTDLEPVTSLARSDGYILIVNSELPAKSLREFIAFGRDPKNKLSYASPGVGNALHLAGELFKARTGVQMTHIPYRGTGPGITDLLGGRIQAMFVTPTLSLEYIKAGKLRALAYTSSERRPILPDVPTMAEAGVDDFVMDGGWFGLFAPANTPTEIVAQLHREIKVALNTSEVQEQLARIGLYPFEKSPSEFKRFVNDQFHYYANLVKLANIKPQ
jgi:tripartite-type tricarboxylate transporter receptor subunit TctC